MISTTLVQLESFLVLIIQPWESNPLLPKDVVPRHYDIFLDPQIEAGTFSGSVKIALDVLSAKDHVILHSKFLTVSSSRLFTADETEVPVKSAFEHAPNEFWVVQLSKNIDPGKYSLRLDFNGSLVGRLEGFYRSTYKRKDGTTRYLAATKFEPTYARRAFPCFDEPSFKASFSTKLVRPAIGGYIALSNMDQIGEESDAPIKGRVTVSFAQTPLMSTYLACFIVCDFPHLPSVNIESSGTKLTVYAREEQLHAANHALKVATDALGYFNKYFEMKYPLPKLDLIAVPDFVSGAMENWGLITFRESMMLAEPTAAASDLLSTANTISHELAHMWFGDIVTMGWWDDLWLNEGFATFLANHVTTLLMPSFPGQATFALNYLQYVMVDDAAVSSHPIIRHVSKPDQITEAFDAISYQKGSSVLRMIENFDPEGFRRAVVVYLDAHKYGNANTSDLWSKLDIEYKQVKNVSRMLDTWTKQMGFPIVAAERKGNSLILKQIRCLSNINVPYDKSSSKYGYKWDIPIKYITSASKEPKSLVMKMEEETGMYLFFFFSFFCIIDFFIQSRLSSVRYRCAIPPPHLEIVMHSMLNSFYCVNFPFSHLSVEEPVPADAKWFKLNADQVGFYRVNYTEAEWKNLQNILTENPNVMSSIDRANLMDDAFALAKAGYINYEIPLQLISYFKVGQEKDWAPWETLNKYFSRLKDLLYSSEEASRDLKLTDLIEKYPEAGAGAAGRLKAVEVTKANIVLYKEYQPVIKQILKKLVNDV
ncbi:unnamed protein product [Nesidiocoris tenuis]|uniref:Aminopeptidase n=1 Tax=Nesidiocoris tenuis TaxID=355587 RepID=A0A6H5H514_9HEMI|nr:unnamed protein product [Nesidiocoris tenuis]